MDHILFFVLFCFAFCFFFQAEDGIRDYDVTGVQTCALPIFYMVARGGSWVDDARACRTAYRYRAMPATQYKLIGFRVVCETSKD